MANYALVLLGVLVSLSWLFVRAVVWRTLLQEKASYKAVFFTLNETYLINNLLPLRLGEIAGAFLLSRKSSLAFWQVISSILIERAMDLALAVGLVLVTLPFIVGGSWAQEAAIGAGAARAAGLYCPLPAGALPRAGACPVPAHGAALALSAQAGRQRLAGFLQRAGGAHRWAPFPARQRLDAAQLGHRHLAVLPDHGGVFSQPQPVMGGLQPGRLGAGGGSPFLAGGSGCDGAFHRRRAVRASGWTPPPLWRLP